MSVRNNIIANYVGQGWSAAMNLAFVPVYVAALGIESYGLIGVFAALQVWLALLDLGMSPTLTREMARFSGGAMSPTAIRDLLHSIELICLGIALAAAAAMAGGAHFIATRWLNTTLPPDTVVSALVLMGVVVALRFIESVYRSALYGLERQVWFNAVNVVLTTVRFGGAALVVTVVRPTIEAFFWWQLAISVVAMVAFRMKLQRVLPPGQRRARFSPRALNDIKRFAAGMIAINLTSLVLIQADKVILSRLLPLGEFGHYTLAFTMCSVIFAVTGPIMQASYPTLVRARASGDRAVFETTYHRSSQLIAVAAASVSGMLVAFAPAIIRVWTGDMVLAQLVGPTLALLAAGTLFNSMMQVPYFGLLAVGETGFSVRANLIAAVALIALLLWLVPIYGAPAAAAGWLVVNGGFVLVGLPLLHRYHLPGLLRDWWLRDVGPVLAVVAGVCMLSASIAREVPFDRLGWFVLLAAAGVAVLLAAIAVSPAARAPLRAAIRDRRMRRQDLGKAS